MILAPTVPVLEYAQIFVTLGGVETIVITGLMAERSDVVNVTATNLSSLEVLKQ